MQSMTRLVRVAAVGEIPVGGRRIAFVDGKAIALFNVDGTVYALEDSCPHAGSSLAAGKLDGAIVTCRAHGLRFDVRTGRMPGVNGLCATPNAVTIVDGEIRVAIESQA
jgi:3-phenylpropionate/trans-cinnamate dioxygenase ferredoxin subunit